MDCIWISNAEASRQMEQSLLVTWTNVREEETSDLKLAKHYWHRWQDIVKQRQVNKENMIQESSLKKMVSSFLVRVKEQKEIEKKEKVAKAIKKSTEKAIKVRNEVLKVRNERQTKEVVEKKEDERLKPRKRLVQIPPRPKLLIDFEEKWQSRAKRLEELKERKRHREEELRKEKERNEQLQLEKEEQEKKDKEMQMKKLKEEEELERQRIKSLFQKAVKHYNKRLLKKCIFTLKMFIQLVRDKMNKADELHVKLLSKNVIRWLRNVVRARIEEAEDRAVSFYRQRLLGGTFQQWTELHYETERRLSSAVNLYKVRLLERLMSRWLNNSCYLRSQTIEKYSKAEGFYNRVLMRHSIKGWKQLKLIHQAEKVKEIYKELLRNRVKSIINDFTAK